APVRPDPTTAATGDGRLGSTGADRRSAGADRAGARAAARARSPGGRVDRRSARGALGNLRSGADGRGPAASTAFGGRSVERTRHRADERSLGGASAATRVRSVERATGVVGAERVERAERYRSVDG